MSPTISPAGVSRNGEPASAPNVRIPKLTYKNRSEPSSSGQVQSTPAVSALAVRKSTAGSNLDDEITTVPTKTSPMRTATCEIDWAVQPVAQKKPLPDMKSTQDATEKRTKKKSSSFFNFLAVKEPTSGALDQYAQLQKKQAEEKGTKFMAGVPSQKLPAEVPRVNTKWNGLPQSAKADTKRPGTASMTALHGGRRNSSATTNSSSKMSRISQRSATSSSIDFDYGPPPSSESLSIKSNPRHDSGTGVYEPVRSSQTHDHFSPVRGPLAHLSGALPPIEYSQPTAAHAAPMKPTIPANESRDLKSKRSRLGARRDEAKASSKNMKEIAPWAEPPESPNPSWPPHLGDSGADDLDFITASPLDPTPDISIADQIAEAERRAASHSMALRRPPSSNAQALSHLEPTGHEENAHGKTAKVPKHKKGKISSRFFRERVDRGFS